LKTKLKLILLVDDDLSTNFMNSLILQDLECADRIEEVRSGDEALEFLKANESPDLIFLDINMPGMDGWMFLKEFEKLPAAEKASKVIVMLTSSLNPGDKQRAKKFDISGFINKPLNAENALEVLKENFPENF